MRSSTRDLLFGVALGALALSALGVGGVALALRHISLAREQAASSAQESAAALVTDTQVALRREARLLARDPALVDGVSKGDWATLARGVSPRLAAITLERVADFVSVVDASGGALLQVPALPPTRISDSAAISCACNSAAAPTIALACSGTSIAAFWLEKAANSFTVASSSCLISFSRASMKTRSR